MKVLELLVGARKLDGLFRPVCLGRHDSHEEQGGIDIVEVPGFDHVVEPPRDAGQEGGPKARPGHWMEEERQIGGASKSLSKMQGHVGENTLIVACSWTT